MTLPQIKYYELYRKTSIGHVLIDTLDEFIKDARITPHLACRILINFDRDILQVLEHRLHIEMTFKGNLAEYHFLDDAWTFLIKDARFFFKMKVGTVPLETDKIEIIACASKISHIRYGEKGDKA